MTAQPKSRRTGLRTMTEAGLAAREKRLRHAMPNLPPIGLQTTRERRESQKKAIAAPSAKPSKYRNQRTQVDGLVFASKKEAGRYSELLLRMKAGEITDLVLQPRIRCVVNLQHVCDYVADFAYYDRAECDIVHEDVKSEATRKLAVYRLKKKLVKACTNIEIVEV